MGFGVEEATQQAEVGKPPGLKRQKFRELLSLLLLMTIVMILMLLSLMSLSSSFLFSFFAANTWSGASVCVLRLTSSPGRHFSLKC